MIVDHPLGGGRGKSKSNRHPVSPWGRPVRTISTLTDGESPLGGISNALYRPRAVSRHDARTSPTPGLLRPGHVTTARDETRPPLRMLKRLLPALDLCNLYILASSNLIAGSCEALYMYFYIDGIVPLNVTTRTEQTFQKLPIYTCCSSRATFKNNENRGREKVNMIC